jgi:lysozyme family protein
MPVTRPGRRAFVLGAVATPAAALWSLRPGSMPAHAQGVPATPANDAASALFRLQERAQKDLGIGLPAAAPATRGVTSPPSGTYDELLPQLVDLIDAVRAREASGPPATRGVAAPIASDSEALLRSIQGKERAPKLEAVTRPRFEDLRDEYLKLFATCTPLPARADKIAWHVARLVARKADYERVGAAVKVPWYFIGAAHALEAGFNFSGHLHNGDPLSARTVHVPKNRPAAWSPPNDWHSSAVDALEYEKFADQADWSLARMLFRWEAYNGFGNRRHDVATPYLWSFSNHYTKGKFVADGVWDGDKVSAQCGAAVMLKALVAGGHVPAP